MSSQTTMKAPPGFAATDQSRTPARSIWRGAEKRPAAPPVVSISRPLLDCHASALVPSAAIAARGTGSYCLPTAKLCVGDQPAATARRGGQQRAGQGQQDERGNVPGVGAHGPPTCRAAKGCARCG